MSEPRAVMAMGTIYTYALGEHVLLPFLLALTRPHLESCDQFQSPLYKKYIDVLENVIKMSGAQE